MLPDVNPKKNKSDLFEGDEDNFFSEDSAFDAIWLPAVCFEVSVACRREAKPDLLAPKASRAFLADFAKVSPLA